MRLRYTEARHFLSQGAEYTEQHLKVTTQQRDRVSTYNPILFAA